MVLCNKLNISSWNAHGLFCRLNNERHTCSKFLKRSRYHKIPNSDIVGIVETKACETDSISLLQGYALLSKTNRQRLNKGIYGGVAVLCKVGISKGITPLPVTHSEYIWIKFKTKSRFLTSKKILTSVLYTIPKKTHLIQKIRKMNPLFWKLLKKIWLIFSLLVKLFLWEISMPI